MKGRKPLYGKVVLKGIMECETGLHIGSSKETLDIGGVDSPVIRNPFTGEPYVPGSSLKGKLRYLLERKLDKDFNRYGGQGVHRHECTSGKCEVCRLFGSTAEGRETNNLPARILVRDMRLEDVEKIRGKVESITELKFENSIDRMSASANPRQIERLPAGAKFDFEIVYNVESKDDMETDISNIIDMLSILEDDALGGHGSRGYGQVKFKIDELTAKRIEYYQTKEESYLLKTEKESKNPQDYKEDIGKIVNHFIGR
jgi:CRISPR-associated protein Csm3